MGTTSGIASNWLALENPALPAIKPTFTTTKSDVTRYGFVVQDMISWSRLRLLVGTRVDKHESASKNHTNSNSPRLGITYLIQPSFSVYGNWTIAEGPNFGSLDKQGHELTDSWRSEQVELGIKKKVKNNVWASIAAFQIAQRNVPELDPLDPTGRGVVSGGENRSRGFEAGLNGEFTENWSWWGSYTYIKYKDITNAVDYERFPLSSLSLRTSYRISSGLLKDLRSAISYRYKSKYCTTFRGAYISDAYEIKPASIVELDFEYPLTKKSGLKLEFGLKNLFDAIYVESNRHGTENFPGQPRTFWIRLNAMF
jgi:iron complex outermembrane receptor protein